MGLLTTGRMAESPELRARIAAAMEQVADEVAARSIPGPGAERTAALRDLQLVGEINKGTAAVWSTHAVRMILRDAGMVAVYPTIQAEQAHAAVTEEEENAMDDAILAAVRAAWSEIAKDTEAR